MRRLVGQNIEKELRNTQTRKDSFRRDKAKWVPLFGFANTWDRSRNGRNYEEEDALLSPFLSKKDEERIRGDVKYFEDFNKPENAGYRKVWDLYQKACLGIPAITGVLYLICKYYDIL